MEDEDVRLTYGTIDSIHIILIDFLRVSVGLSEGGEVGALVAIL